MQSGEAVGRSRGPRRRHRCIRRGLPRGPFQAVDGHSSFTAILPLFRRAPTGAAPHPHGCCWCESSHPVYLVARTASRPPGTRTRVAHRWWGELLRRESPRLGTVIQAAPAVDLVLRRSSDEHDVPCPAPHPSRVTGFETLLSERSLSQQRTSMNRSFTRGGRSWTDGASARNRSSTRSLR